MGLNAKVDWELGDDGEASFGVLTIDDQEAIRAYFDRTKPITPEATRIKDEYIKWYDGLWWWEKTSQENFDRARNMRNLFNLANVKTIEEKKTVEETIKTGITKEQLMGEPDRRLSTGMFPVAKAPLIPVSWQIAGAAVAGIALIAAVHGAVTSAVRR